MGYLEYLIIIIKLFLWENVFCGSTCLKGSKEALETNVLFLFPWQLMTEWVKVLEAEWVKSERSLKNVVKYICRVWGTKRNECK